MTISKTSVKNQILELKDEDYIFDLCRLIVENDWTFKHGDVDGVGGVIHIYNKNNPEDYYVTGMNKTILNELKIELRKAKIKGL